MNGKISSFSLVWLALCLQVFVGVSANAYSEESPYTAVTASKTDISTDELALLLVPLSLAELEVEAEAWLAHLKAKAHEISNTEVAAKRKKKEIEETEEAIEAVEKVQKAVEAVDKAKAEGGEAQTEELSDKLEEATEAAEKAKAEVLEAADVEKVTAENKGATASAEAAIESIKEFTESDQAPNVVVEEVADELSEKLSTVGESNGTNKAELEEVAQAAKDAAAAKAEVKSELLEDINELRTERTALIDRVNVVLDAVDAKGGDTAAQRQYIAAVALIYLDVSDSSAAWSTIKGWLVSEEGGLRWLRNLIKFFGTVLGFFLVASILGKLSHKLLKASRGTTVLMQKFIAKSVRRAFTILGIIVGLSALEVNIGPLLTVIGAAGFVVAFALQDTLGNFASGIMILLYRPFDVGDLVDVAGVTGTVASLNLVSVGIKTLDNKAVIVPNNAVWGNVITNATGSSERRVDMLFGIGYNDNIEKAQTLLEDLLESNPLVLQYPEPIVRVHELGDSSVNFVCRPWVKTEDYWTVYWDVTRAVKETFDEHNVSIPFPQRDIHLHQTLSPPPIPPTHPSASTEEAHQGEDFPENSDGAE